MPLYSEIRFLDGFQFMSQSLESLANTMQTSSLQLLQSKYSDRIDFDFEKVRGKGFSLTFIWTALKKFPYLLLPTGTFGETVSVEK